MVWLTGEEIDDEGHFYIHHPRYRGLVLRRDYDDLSDWLDRAEYMYRSMGAKIVGRPAVVRFPSGARIRAGYLKNKSYSKYLGHEYQRILIEELTQIGEEMHLVHILGSLRSTIEDLRPQAFFTSNPPGVGHLWVKRRYIDPAPHNTIFTGEDGRKRIYVPATIDDNPILVKKDPGYIAYIESLETKDPDLYHAWRFGNWDVMAGQYFKTFKKSTHVVPPFTPSKSFDRVSGMDWGRTNPFAWLALAIEPVTYINDDGDVYKFIRAWVYKELYGTNKSPKEWAAEIKKLEPNIRSFRQNRADPSAFVKQPDGSRSIAKQFSEADVLFVEANNDRVNGWEAVKNWFSMAPDGLPYLMVTENCKHLIETIPAQVHDDTNPEDLDTDGEDHAVDALRYILIHLDWVDAETTVIPREKAQEDTRKYVHAVDASDFNE